MKLYFGILAALAIAISNHAAMAAFDFSTPTGSTTNDGPVDAYASFTVSNGSIGVQLTNLLQNLKADGQMISGIYFDVSGATGTGSLVTVNSGYDSSISAGGAYTLDITADPLLRWKADNVGASVTLTTLSGGAPKLMIIGPDSAGGFAQVGQYTNANGSVTNGAHNPSVLGSAIFNITVPGVTTSSIIRNVVFQFGTNDAINQVVGVTATPEPASLVIWSLITVIASVIAVRMRRDKV